MRKFLVKNLIKLKNKYSFIPAQTKGTKLDYTNSVVLNSYTEVPDLYDRAKKRLFEINDWHSLCGKASAFFYLTDNNGNEKNSFPIKGDHIRIGVPGPKSIEGSGFDWVEIEEVESSEYTPNRNISYIKVRPSENPFKKNGITAHFFSSAATSTFMVESNNLTVTASYHGRNEFANIKETKGFGEQLRHFAIALGAQAGFSKVQWKLLINNIVQDKK